MAHKRKKLDVSFDLILDGDELSVYLGDSDVTADVKNILGWSGFKELESEFAPYEQDPYDVYKDQKIMEEFP